MLTVPHDSTYFPGPQLELARGGLVDGAIQDSATEQIWVYFKSDVPRSGENGTFKPTLLRIGNFSFIENASKALCLEPSASAPVVSLPAHDPWLLETKQVIANHRDLPPGWDGLEAIAPSRECLDAAEALAQLISARPMSVRPRFAVDSKGCPSFASYTDHFYLHLTVDGPKRLSWYAVVDGEEFFEDDIAFDGVEMPQPLDELF